MTVLAIDIGGTKMAAGIVGDDGTILRRDRTPTNRDDPWPDFAGMLDRLVDGDHVDGVGIGCGGPMTWPAGEVSPLNIPAWRDFPLRARLAERYPGVPVRLHNDAVAVAIAEHWRGAGQSVDNLIGMVVSTGVGGGIVSGGRILDGATGNAGHIGHVAADPTGPTCVCGGRGCLEAIARGPATVAWAREQGSRARDGRELAQLAADGDPTALAAFARAGDAVGRVIAWCAALLDLQMVVVGGGLAQTGPPLWDPMLAAVREHAVLPFLQELRVVPPALGGDAGLVGAAALVLAGDRYWSAD